MSITIALIKHNWLIKSKWTYHPSQTYLPRYTRRYLLSWGKVSERGHHQQSTSNETRQRWRWRHILYSVRKNKSTWHNLRLSLSPVSKLVSLVTNGTVNPYSLHSTPCVLWKRRWIKHGSVSVVNKTGCYCSVLTKCTNCRGSYEVNCSRNQTWRACFAVISIFVQYSVVCAPFARLYLFAFYWLLSVIAFLWNSA